MTVIVGGNFQIKWTRFEFGDGNLETVDFLDFETQIFFTEVYFTDFGIMIFEFSDHFCLLGQVFSLNGQDLNFDQFGDDNLDTVDF